MDQKISSHRKELLDKLKKSNRIFNEDFDELETDLEVQLEKKFIKKKDRLISLLHERNLLLLKLNNTISY